MNPEDYPPRYKQFNEDGHKHLIMDEPEWLARPALWGARELQTDARERQNALANRYLLQYYFDLACDTTTCEMCKGLLTRYIESGASTFSESDFGPPNRNSQACHEFLHGPFQMDRCYDWEFCSPIYNLYRGACSDAECWNQVYEAFARRLWWIKPTLNYRPDLAKWERWLALELVGPNPFRPIAFDPAWRTEVVTTLARIADETAELGNLPVLADALQEAGCDVPEILTHLRGPGPHVRGCWVVDLALGSE